METLLKEHAVKRTGSIALTIGIFDGLHRGHQYLLKVLSQSADIPFLITFREHPQKIIYGKDVPCLTTIQEKLALIKIYAPKIKTIVLPFSKSISRLSPEDFLKIVKRYIPFNYLIVGYDSTIGHDKIGDLEHLNKLSQKLDFQIKSIAAFFEFTMPISSRLIRTMISSGNLEKAKKFLGRDYSISGTVIKGRDQGSRLGYPTANLNLGNKCTPPSGVYIAEIELEHNQCLKGVCNLGFSPTFNKDEKLLETHIFNFNHSLYGKMIKVSFKQFIREEKKFQSAEELKRAISQDIAYAKSAENLFM